MPPSLRDRPEPGIIPNLLVEAFLTLHNSRGAGFNGAIPLTLSDIVTVAHIFGYSSPAEEYEFIKAMQALDGFYLKQESDRIKQQSKHRSK